jgi:hypothetical protein
MPRDILKGVLCYLILRRTKVIIQSGNVKITLVPSKG